MSKKNKDKFVPYSKSSKKEKRNTWDIPCFTKVEPDKRRKKDRHDKRKKDDYYFDDENDMDY